MQMEVPRREGVWLHRFAVLTACSGFVLVIAGGLVTSTGSGLAVPDWPLSYGQLMPPMVGGILYEHGHRMVATFVGLLTTILAIWISRTEARKWVRVLGWSALSAVVVQGILGGLTVLFLLPTPISVSHATLAQSFFSLLVFLAIVTSPNWKNAIPVGSHRSGKTVRFVQAVTVVIFLQLILGALMRHTDSGLAIPDFPLSYGGLVPPLDAKGISWVNSVRLDQDLPSVQRGQIIVHYLHRLWALVVAVVVIASARHIFRTYSNEPRLREPALLLVLLVAVQILLGALSVWTGRNVGATTAHVAAGALLLATSVVLSARSLCLINYSERTDPKAFTVEASVV